MSHSDFVGRSMDLIYDTRERALSLIGEQDKDAASLEPNIREVLKRLELLSMASDQWHEIEIKNEDIIRNNMPNIECVKIRLTYDPEIRTPGHELPQDQLACADIQESR